MSRIEEELGLLRGWWPGLEYEPSAGWVHVAEYPLAGGIWDIDVIDVAFQMPAHLPAEAPYGFYVRPGLVLAGGAVPSNYAYPTVEPPFGDGPWGRFSWAPAAWRPMANVHAGDNMLHFAASIRDRLREAS